MVVWLKHYAGIQETKVHAYNPTKCLAGAFFRPPRPGLSPFPSLPLRPPALIPTEHSKPREKVLSQHRNISWNNHPFTQTLPLQATPLLFLRFQNHHRRKIKPDWKRKYFSEPAAFDK